MPSERIQRDIDRLLDEAGTAIAEGDWELVKRQANSVLALDPNNVDATSYQEAAARATGSTSESSEPSAPVAPAPQSDAPSSFASSRYEVRSFLGEGSKKRVFLAHDSVLDREVAFALIRTEGFGETDRRPTSSPVLA